jgi:alpha-ribazole phosphatase
MQLYLIRHTTPAVPPGVCYGQADVDVAASFYDEVQTVRAKLTGINPVASYSSPLARASRLAASLELVQTRHDARLMELSFGDWELRSWDDIPRDHLDRWGNDYANNPPPRGETFTELQIRATEFLRELMIRHRGQDVIAVTHAGVIRALLAEVLNLPLTEVFRFHLDYGSVTHLRLADSMPSVGYVNR